MKAFGGEKAEGLVAAGGVMYTAVGAFPRGVATVTLGAPALGYSSLTVYSYLSGTSTGVQPPATEDSP